MPYRRVCGERTSPTALAGRNDTSKINIWRSGKGLPKCGTNYCSGRGTFENCEVTLRHTTQGFEPSRTYRLRVSRLWVCTWAHESTRFRGPHNSGTSKCHGKSAGDPTAGVLLFHPSKNQRNLVTPGISVSSACIASLISMRSFAHFRCSSLEMLPGTRPITGSIEMLHAP